VWSKLDNNTCSKHSLNEWYLNENTLCRQYKKSSYDLNNELTCFSLESIHVLKAWNIFFSAARLYWILNVCTWIKLNFSWRQCFRAVFLCWKMWEVFLMVFTRNWINFRNFIGHSKPPTIAWKIWIFLARICSNFPARIHHTILAILINRCTSLQICKSNKLRCEKPQRLSISQTKNGH
jgi:hypothetical protein